MLHIVYADDVSAEEFQEGLKIPLQAVQAIWRKAEELVGNSNAISPAPGYDSTCKMVISRSGKCPHLVTSSKKGKYTCDNDCPNFKSMGICSHTVAVAHVNGSLREVCSLYRKGKHVPSISKLVLSGVPIGIGNKGNRVSKKRKREQESSRVFLGAAEVQPGPSHALVTPDVDQGQLAGAYPTSCTQSTVLPPVPGMSEFFMPHTQPMAAPSMQCGTNQGTIHIQSPTHWNAPCYNYQHMNPPQYDGIFSVCFRSGNISVCNGFRNKFDKNSLPPNDLCIQHEEWRSYISPVTKLPESRFGNAYYHANPLCIRARWPMFFPGHIIVPVDVQSRLLPQHKLLLFSAFGVNV